MKALSNPGRAPASAVSNGAEGGAAVAISMFLSGLARYAFPFLEEVPGSEAGLAALAGVIFMIVTSIARNLTSEEYVNAPRNESSDTGPSNSGGATRPVPKPTAPPSPDESA